MHVIYVHGVSERPDNFDFDKRLVARRRKFVRFVAQALNRSVTTFDAAAWGDLCPHVPFRTSSGQPLGYGDSTTTPSLIEWHAFVRDGRLNAAAFVERAHLSHPTLDEDEAAAVGELIAELDGANVTVDLPASNETFAEVLERIAQARPGVTAVKAQNLGLKSIIVSQLAAAVEMVAAPFGGPLRDTIARELAARWIDIIWYFGRGRADVRARILQRFNEITRRIPDQPVIVLAHSLGGFIAHDAITSAAFQEQGLHQRGPWFLFCLGSQLTIYQKLGLMEQPLVLGPDLAARVALRNVYDTNDPLGFAVDDQDLDSSILSGVDFASAHGSYLDSAIVLRSLAKDLRKFLDDMKKKAP